MTDVQFPNHADSYPSSRASYINCQDTEWRMFHFQIIPTPIRTPVLRTLDHGFHPIQNRKQASARTWIIQDINMDKEVREVGDLSDVLGLRGCYGAWDAKKRFSTRSLRYGDGRFCVHKSGTLE